jgi:hypothetical protein
MSSALMNIRVPEALRTGYTSSGQASNEGMPNELLG